MEVILLMISETNTVGGLASIWWQIHQTAEISPHLVGYKTTPHCKTFHDIVVVVTMTSMDIDLA